VGHVSCANHDELTLENWSPIRERDYLLVDLTAAWTRGAAVSTSASVAALAPLMDNGPAQDRADELDPDVDAPAHPIIYYGGRDRPWGDNIYLGEPANGRAAHADAMDAPTAMAGFFAGGPGGALLAANHGSGYGYAFGSTWEAQSRSLSSLVELETKRADWRTVKSNQGVRGAARSPLSGRPTATVLAYVRQLRPTRPILCVGQYVALGARRFELDMKPLEKGPHPPGDARPYAVPAAVR